MSRRYSHSDTVPRLVLWADRQESGRGRLKRNWHSVTGKDLTFSTIFPSPVDRADTPKISLCAGLSLVAVLINKFSINAALRWPNDVLTPKGKLAGILSAYLEKPHAVICGIGINVNSTSADLNLPTAHRPTTMLDEIGHETPLDQVLSKILSEFEKNWHLAKTQNFNDLSREFDVHNYYRDKNLHIIPGGAADRDEVDHADYEGRGFIGSPVGLHLDGSLLVKVNDEINYPVSINDLIIPLA